MTRTMAVPPVEYVAVRPEHEPLLRDIFASARRAEISGFPEGLRDQLTLMQFTAQRAQYTSGYPDAVDRLLSADGAIVGRLLVDDRPNVITLVDIAILESHRGRGIGTGVLRDLCARADRRQVPIRLRAVASDPRVRGWYAGFGFVETGVTGGHVDLIRTPRRENGL